MSAMEDAEAFVGTWKIVQVENDEAFSKAAGIPPNRHAVAKQSQDKLRQTVQMETGGLILSKLSGVEGMPTLEERFKLGQEFDSMDLIGRPIKVKVGIEDGRWVEERVGPNVVKIRKMVDGDKVIMESECNDEIMKTTYEIC